MEPLQPEGRTCVTQIRHTDDALPASGGER